jgi:hypothetical protein
VGEPAVIAFNRRRQIDQEPIARVRSTWSLSRDDIADLLCARLNDIPAGSGELPRAQIEILVREQLATHADARHWWRDREEYPGETTNDELYAWAQKQAAKL